MKDRILEFLKKENKSSAQFADEIGVQPSGISHIISGRNNPSLEFIIKMLGKYPFISTDWLLFGKGSMYKDQSITDLFDSSDTTMSAPAEDTVENKEKLNDRIISRHEKQEMEKSNIEIILKNVTKAQRIVCFYKDNTFHEYFPADE
jgi:transcriptional regulator with XRE-family HTH domain